MKKHDGFFKRALENPKVAEEFFREYLPNEIKELVDITKLKMTKDSFVDKHLKRSMSDALFISETGNEYIYILIEAQSSVDQMMAFRLMKYMVSICERHLKPKAKTTLPLIYPVVLYNGKDKYTATKNVWDLFTHAKLAKKFFTETYHVIDLQNMDNEDIKKHVWLGVMQSILKHIHTRDLSNKLEEIITTLFPQLKYSDGMLDIDYMESVICYTISSIPKENIARIGELLTKTIKEGDKIMQTAADYFREEGVKKGMEKGVKKRNIEIAKNMLRAGSDINFISSVTGLSLKDIRSLS